MFRRVAVAPNPIVAGMLADLLRASGIRVLDVQQSPHVSLAGSDDCFFVEVVAQDHARAVVVLRAAGREKCVVA